MLSEIFSKRARILVRPTVKGMTAAVFCVMLLVWLCSAFCSAQGPMLGGQVFVDNGSIWYSRGFSSPDKRWRCSIQRGGRTSLFERAGLQLPTLSWRSGLDVTVPLWLLAVGTGVTFCTSALSGNGGRKPRIRSRVVRRGVWACAALLAVWFVTIFWGISWASHNLGMGLTVEYGCVKCGWGGNRRGLDTAVACGPVGTYHTMFQAFRLRRTKPRTRERYGLVLPFRPDSVYCSKTLRIPLWMPLLFVAATTGVFWVYDRRRFPRGHCQSCAYDLKGNTSGVCPECGARYELQATTATPSGSSVNPGPRAASPSNDTPCPPDS